MSVSLLGLANAISALVSLGVISQVSRQEKKNNEDYTLVYGYYIILEVVSILFSLVFTIGSGSALWLIANIFIIAILYLDTVDLFLERRRRDDFINITFYIATGLLAILLLSVFTKLIFYIALAIIGYFCLFKAAEKTIPGLLLLLKEKSTHPENPAPAEVEKNKAISKRKEEAILYAELTYAIKDTVTLLCELLTWEKSNPIAPAELEMKINNLRDLAVKLDKSEIKYFIAGRVAMLNIEEICKDIKLNKPYNKPLKDKIPVSKQFVIISSYFNLLAEQIVAGVKLTIPEELKEILVR